MMTSTDPIADMLTRVRNAIAVRKREVLLPYSKVKAHIADTLATHGYLAGTEVVESPDAPKQLKIVISEDGSFKITEVSRLSKPGRRVYAKCDAIPRVKHGRGLVLVSTSQGIMTGQEAKAKRLGGELICEVY
jgi:small subunit ribosomal protein S8